MILVDARDVIVKTWQEASYKEKWQYGIIAFFGGLVMLSGTVFALTSIGLGVDDHTKDIMTEVCSQTLNGCFTLLAIVTHPMRFYILMLALFNIRHDEIQAWFSNLPIDFASKHGIVSMKTIRRLLWVMNLNCFFQYPLTVVMWGYNYKVRPTWVIPVFLPLSFVCGIWSGIWLYKLNQKVKKHQEILLENEVPTV